MEENQLFDDSFIFIVNGEEIAGFDLSTVHPSRLFSVRFISDLEAVKRFGKEKRGGVVDIEIREE